MKRFEFLFKFVIRANDCVRAFYFLKLFLGVFFFSFSLSLRGQSSCTTNNFDTTSLKCREDILEQLEMFYEESINTTIFWHTLRNKFKGSDTDYAPLRDQLVVKCYELYSAFGTQCLSNNKITENDKSVFKIKLVKELESLQEKLILNPPSPVLAESFPAPPLECENLDFEKCDFTGWQLFQGNVISSGSVAPPPSAFSYINVAPATTYGTNFPILNLNANREGLQHSMITTPGIDPNVPIQMIKPGGGCSAMIGDGFGTQWRAASIKRSIVVTPSNYNFYYSYAVVMQNPNHSQTDQPYFRIRLYDANNKSIDCAKYDVYAGNGDPDWLVKGNGGNTLNYVDWKSAFIPLQAYIGQTLTIEFTVGDCNQGGHACYAYIEGECDVPVKLSDTAACNGHPVVITAPAGAKTYLWSTGETGSSITVEKQGEYWVRMEGTAGGCFAYDTVHVGTYDVSTASFTIDTVCEGSSTHFTDHSFPNNSISSWKWDFQNTGNTNSTVQNPNNIYGASGNYTAKLTITNVHGCEDDTTRVIFIAPKPVAAFNSNVVCLGDSTSLNNQSSGTISKYKWDFLNNNQFTANTGNAKYKYANAASTKLKVTTQYGCSDSITNPVVINPLPIANFSQLDVCQKSSMSFNNTSSISSGGIISWKWNFGDGSTDNKQNPSHTFVNYGSKSVKLKVSSNLGCLDSITKTVKVFEKPIINFTTTNVCEKLSSALTNNSTLNSLATFATWQWDILNDGSSEYSTKNAAHLFNTAGTYRIMLKGTTNEGCWDTISKSLTIYPLPHADFNSTFVCKGKATQYTDKSTGNIATWHWDFDNNNSMESAMQNPSYNFASNGNFNSKLKITSDKGCSDSIVKSTIVHPLPLASYSATSVCYPLPISFSNSSSVSEGNITYQKWIFASDADTSNNFNPSKSFVSHGTYNVKLFVLTDSGCVDSISKPIVYFEKPTVDFNAVDLCANESLNLNNISAVSSSTFSDWKWDIDNNNSTDYTSKNSTHKYSQHGLKTIQLIGKTAQGCLDTMVKTIDVFPLPIADFNLTPKCVNDSAAFTNSSSIVSGTITNYQWNFNEGKTASAPHAKNKFASEGIKTVRLIITSDKNCKDTIDKTVEIYPLPQPQFTADAVCLNASNTFTNSSVISSKFTANQISNLLWKFDDGQTSSTLQAQHMFNTAGTHQVKLIATSSYNCIDSTTKPIVVHPLPSPKFSSTTPAGCARWCVDFSNSTTISSGSIKNYSWVFGDGATANIPNASHCFENMGNTPLSFDISLSATSDKGCTKDTTINQMITAYPITNADFTFTPNELTEDNNLVYFTNASTGENAWTWKYDDGAGDIIENPQHKFTTIGEHSITLVVNNAYDCMDSITKKINQKPVWSYHIPNAFTPNGDGKNDKFYVYGYNIIDFKLYIFNRWGELIFTSYDINEGWNGIYNGDLVQIDTYVYKAYLTDIFGDKHTEVGIVNCIR